METERVQEALEHVHALAVDGVEDLVQHARVVRADDLDDEVAVAVQPAADGLASLDGRKSRRVLA